MIVAFAPWVRPGFGPGGGVRGWNRWPTLGVYSHPDTRTPFPGETAIKHCKTGDVLETVCATFLPGTHRSAYSHGHTCSCIRWGGLCVPSLGPRALRTVPSPAPGIGIKPEGFSGWLFSETVAFWVVPLCPAWMAQNSL